MNKVQFSTIEKYMLSCMRDSAHDKEHRRKEFRSRKAELFWFCDEM